MGQWGVPGSLYTGSASGGYFEIWVRGLTTWGAAGLEGLWVGLPVLLLQELLDHSDRNVLVM